MGCSPESGNPLARNYHNTTARYNSYFIAKEKMKEVEGIVWKNNMDNFNKILNIFPVIKLEDTAQIKEPSEECLKKASLAIQRHKNSRWTDRSFNLIAKTRFYLKDYKNAIETYKYVNTKGKDKNAKHAALISLMRLFIETKEYEKAISVATVLRKENLNKVNSRDLNLVKAYYFAEHGDYRKAESYIGFAIPYIDELNERSRLYFIIGQIRQKNGDDKGAYSSYRSALKNNPTYEIAFYSRLNMAQVSDVDGKGDEKKVKKNFTKLLKDIRNEDFKDKIYYEMAKFELKSDNITNAVAYLEKSIRTSTINSTQKGLSYLKLGELYYEKLKKYELAKAYYDSTVSLLPEDADEYSAAFRRQSSLTNFVTQINTIHLEDSLQRLSKMDSTTLNQYIAKIEEERSLAVQKQTSTSGNNNEAAFNPLFDEPSNSNQEETSNEADWYFYSPAALSRGSSQFVKIWGNRPLEDNWRLSKKEKQADTSEENRDNSIAESKSQKGITDKGATGAFNKKEFLSRIPKTPQEINLSNKRIEDAYFALGKIYDQELEESSNSIETFERLLKRFPKTEYKSEIYYYLYLLNNKVKGPKAEEYKKSLANEFPNSLYNKLITNSNYLSDGKKEEKLLADLYDQSYKLYKIDSLKKASVKIDSITNIYPENIISDKFTLLKVLISGRTQKREVYKQNLNQFIKSFPESSLVPYAQKLLQVSESSVNENSGGSKEEIEIGNIYKEGHDDRPHYFSILYSGSDQSTNNLRTDLEAFNNTYNAGFNMDVEFLSLDPQNKLLLVKGFPNKNEATQYHARFKEDSTLLRKYKDLNLNLFLISDENFETFNQNKDLSGYLSFFQKTY